VTCFDSNIGLAVSRAIGDVWTQQLGVISVPDILEHKIDESGIWALFLMTIFFLSNNVFVWIA
jgi:hypothetical protein